MCLAQGPQHSDTSEAQTPGPSVLSQATELVSIEISICIEKVYGKRSKNSNTNFFLFSPLFVILEITFQKKC